MWQVNEGERMRHEVQQWIKVTATLYSLLADMKAVVECTETRTYPVRYRQERLKWQMEVSVEQWLREGGRERGRRRRER